MSKCVLQAQGLGRRFHEGVIDVTVLQGIDLQVHAGETLAAVSYNPLTPPTNRKVYILVVAGCS